ncbi:hypothetical protein Pst134EA_006922 [Puccinia striiformis f. sp. tritici]|uniref:hypothetical protein n=1 Tax=Puccinia striiformis f. sp. tritici TaxID=168172 RepID=UPI002007892D|nr:hypothetical protein Pst134EA_006922 [Puccinia striiformis f. sp. tritici]KAH9469634.1 hypothetical protein Pst134EA_006922 [Puccinia striiformis f. sp. tritici]KAI9616708.1 hypothetical protein KEM48_005125 [Puccinia striiformis f. sp. tritici PST-130]
MDLEALQELLHSLQQQQQQQQEQQGQPTGSTEATQNQAQPTTSHLFDLLKTLTPINTATQTVEAHPNKRIRIETLNQNSTDDHQLTSTDHPAEQPATFDEALPTLKRLIGLPHFLDKIQQIKEDQDQFELRAIDQRNQFKSELDRTLKKLDTNKDRVKIQKLKSEFESKIKSYDQSILVKWDQIRSSQLHALQTLKVPIFSHSDSNHSSINHTLIYQQQNLVLNFLLDSLNERAAGD